MTDLLLPKRLSLHHGWGVCVSLFIGLNLSAQAQTVYPYADEAAVVDSLVQRMTLEEKLGQLTQYTGGWDQTGPVVPQGGEREVRLGRVGSFLNLFGANATCNIQRIAVEESRLKIPLIFGHDVIHGFRTIFPTPLAESAAFDPVLAEQTARIAAREATAAGLHWTFAPMVDIARDPRWGRIVEGSGEDPYLGSILAAARVRGFQGHRLADLAADTTLAACAKHFAAYGGAEAGRDYNTVDVSNRTLREVYLPPYQAAVDAGVQTLMSSFNEIGGVPATANRFIFNDLLRDEWGFDGFVVGDYTAVWELIQHRIAADSAEAGRKALYAGVDMSMVDGIYIRHLAREVEAGRLPLTVVNEAVRRVLRVKYRLGLFEDPYRYCKVPEREATTLLAPAHRQLARVAAQRSIVLLKNTGNLLPLSTHLQTLAVIGSLANDATSVLGAWAATGRDTEAVSLLTGIRQAVPHTRVLYAPGYVEAKGGFEQVVAAAYSPDTTGFAQAIQLARQSDAVVLVLGEHRELSGEAASRADITLPGVQEKLAQRILTLGKPVVIVLMNGRPLTIASLAETAAAMLETWHLGSEMGHAVADVLFGTVNPGGKLPVTFPRSVGQIPLYYNAKSTGRPANDQTKYNSKYIDTPNTPLYPFGYGLSYTRFSFSNLRLSTRQLSPGGTLTIQVDVTNVGTRAGDEVPQLYIRDEVRSVTPPVRELKGFQRITLQPGETRTATFELSPRELRFWGLEEHWQTEPGWFTVYVGPSSVEGLEDRFELLP